MWGSRNKLGENATTRKNGLESYQCRIVRVCRKTIFCIPATSYPQLALTIATQLILTFFAPYIL